LFSTLPIALMTSLFPALAQNANDKEKFRRYLGETYRFLLVVVFAACALASPVAAPLVELFYGKQYLPTASLLIVLIWSEVPIFYFAALGNALVAKGLQRHLPGGAGLGAAVNILLNLVLIPKFAALGASWATVVSYSSGLIYLMFIADARELALQGLRIALWPFLLSVGIAVSFPSWHVNFVWKLLMASLIYFAGCWWSGMIKKSDVERLGAMFKQGIA
jgi:O-antigen/teichoic acid export membrane protein